MTDPDDPTSAVELAPANFFLDATPLLDTSWTGISVVCANIARQLLRRGLRLGFCLGELMLPFEAVIDALERSSGLYLARDLVTGRLQTTTLALPRNQVSVGLSASVKRFHRVFDVECSWVHDLSTLLQPEYHTEDNIAWHTERIIEDLTSNDVTVCISRATLDDVVAYLGVDPARLVLAHNGVEWPWWFAVRARNEPAPTARPYLLVLGTREPRKNLSLVLEMLEAFPELLSNYQLVIVGQYGWPEDQTALPSSLAQEAENGRICIMGFVSDYDKYRLLLGAEATLFPSIFEGFGLPVLESLSVGTPCVASFSSSIPEVGGAFCQYFDPFSKASLHAAVQQTLGLRLKKDTAFAGAAKVWAGRFTWEASIDLVLAALAPIILQSYTGKAHAYSQLQVDSERL